MRSPIERGALVMITMILLAAPAAAQEACHHGVVLEEHIEWRSRYSFASSDAPVVVPRELEVTRVEGGHVGEDSVLVTGGSVWVTVVARQRLVDRADVTLRPPLTAGPQRITLEGRFEPRFGGELVRRVGYYATASITSHDRDRLEWTCGEPARGAMVLYVGAERPRGAVRSRAERSAPVLWVGGALLGVGVLVGVGLYRGLGRRAALERAELVLEERFEALERGEGGRDGP